VAASSNGTPCFSRFESGAGGADNLNDNAGANLLDGGGENDFFNSDSAGVDRVFAGDGDDSGELGGGADVVRAGGGADRFYGETGDDRLYGGAGRDLLDGMSGHDTIDGGGGRDDCRHGENVTACE
jgi:Ca2+-binding RTX toxin-like protein